MSPDDTLDVMIVGYFPPTGAVAELFRTIATGLARHGSTSVLAPEHVEPIPGVVMDFRFPYSTRRPDRAVLGRGWSVHLRAGATRPTSTLLFTQHPLNVAAAAAFRTSALALWWHEPVARGQASRPRKTVYAVHDRAMVPRCERIVVASESVRSSVPEEFRDRTVVVPFPSPEGFDSPSNRFAESPTDLVFFGKLETYKGLDTLAEALVLLEAKGMEPKLRVVGAGSILAAAPVLAEFSDRRPDRVDHVAEYAPADDIASALRAGRVCVLPYLTAAGSSAIGVAGLQRAALAASTAGSFGDYLTNGVNARLHHPGNAVQLAESLESLLTDFDQRKRLGDALHELQATRFGLDATSVALREALLGDIVEIDGLTIPFGHR